MLSRIHILALFSFFTNKNLFLERFSFLKSLKTSTQNKLYLTYFIFSNYVVWSIVFSIWYFLKWPSFLLAILIIGYLLLKLVLLDIDDWQLYFKDDIRLAIPVHNQRYLTILLNILFHKFFVSDNVLIYFVALKLLMPIDWGLLLLLAVTYLAISAFILSLYLVLKVGTLKLKAFYSVFSYLSAMLSMFIFGSIIIKLITYVVNIAYSIILGIYEFDLGEILYKAANIFSQFTSNTDLLAFSALALISLSVFGLLLIYFSANLEMQDDSPNLSLAKFVKYMMPFNKDKDELQNALLIKEYQLIVDIYKYNFKQYYFTFFVDRPYAVLLALIFNFSMLNLSCKNLLFFGLSTVLFMTEVGSIMGNKLIANLSFIPEYNTVRQINCNGISIQKLSHSKLNLFYKIRFLPTILFIATIVMGHVILKSSPILVAANIVSLLVVFYVYPKDYFTRNLISTRMDYKDYEAYLTEKNILEAGTDDFYIMSWLYNFMLYSTAVLSAIGCLFPSFYNLSAAVCVLIFVAAPLVCHKFMAKIQRNIMSFIERGDYSADFSKIFKNVQS